MTSQLHTRRSEAGFTLVELAIVLVIIGLIVGGVLVGQDLIKTAEIRSVVSDLEKYNAAANTFRNKYNGLPGDLLSTRAAQFGLTTRDGSVGQGDGNGVMEGCAAASTALGCENAVMWIDLTAAQLIGDAFNTTNSVADGNNGPAAAVNTVALMAGYLPTTSLRDSSFVYVLPEGGRNFFFVGNLTAVAGGAGAGGAVTPGTIAGLTPLEASQIDDKMDDGIPVSGIVRAVSAITALAGATVDVGAVPATGVCVNQGAAAGIQNDETYNTTNSTWANELNCDITVRTSF